MQPGCGYYPQYYPAICKLSSAEPVLDSGLFCPITNNIVERDGNSAFTILLMKWQWDLIHELVLRRKVTNDW